MMLQVPLTRENLHRHTEIMSCRSSEEDDGGEGCAKYLAEVLPPLTPGTSDSLALDLAPPTTPPPRRKNLVDNMKTRDGRSRM